MKWVTYIIAIFMGVSWSTVIVIGHWTNDLACVAISLVGIIILISLISHSKGLMP